MPALLNRTMSYMLRELGNIGCGRALTALSELVSTDFHIRVPEIELAEYSRIPILLGDVEDEMVGVMLEVSGELDGVFLLLLHPEMAERILDKLGVPVNGGLHELTPSADSALLELGNIMGSSYMTAVSEFTDFDIRLSVPALAIDMLGSLLSIPVIRFAQMDSPMLYIQNVFTIDEKDWVGSTLLLPELSSAYRLKERLEELL